MSNHRRYDEHNKQYNARTVIDWRLRLSHSLLSPVITFNVMTLYVQCNTMQ